MKYLITVMSILLLGCSYTTETTRSIAVLDDRTEDAFYLKPEISPILNYLGMDTNIWSGYSLSYKQVNSLYNNTQKTVEIPAESELFSNDIKRRKRIDSFKKQASDILDKQESNRSLQSKSIIWEPLLSEIERLCSEGVPTTILLYSDLRENNSKWYSAYRSTRNKKNSSSNILELFLRQTQGKNLCEFVEVVVLYRPQNTEEDESFNKMFAVYQEALSEVNVTVRHATSLNEKIVL